MRIGLLIPHDIDRVGGGATFEADVFLAILRAAKGSQHEYVLFSPKQCDCPEAEGFEIVPVRWKLFRQIAFKAVGVVNRLLASIRIPHLMVQEAWLDSLLFNNRIGFFLNLSPSSPTMAVPYLVFVWDLQHRTMPYFPEISARGRWTLCERRFSELLQRAAIVVATGETGRREVERFYAIPAARLHQMPHPTPSFALEARVKLPPLNGLPEKFLFYPAQFWPHKNHVTVLRAMAILRETRGYTPFVVFSGSDQGNLAHVQRVVADLHLEDHVRFAGFVSRAELIGLYQNTEAMVYPSLGGPENLPPLEALALGCPVIAARVDGAEAQFGSSAILYDGTDAAQLAEAIHAIRTNPSVRNELIEKGRQRAAQLSIDQFARDLVKLVEDFSDFRSCWSADAPYVPRFAWKRFFTS